MSIILTDQGAESRNLAVYFGPEEAPGEPLNVVYDPTKYTPILEQKSRNFANTNMPASFYAEQIEAVIISWDAKDTGYDPEELAAYEADKTLPKPKKKEIDFPATHDNIMRVPIGALVKIFKALQEDQRPSGEANED